MHLVLFRKTRVPPESVAITRTSFIEMGQFPPQLLPETAKGVEHSLSGWSGHHCGAGQEARTQGEIFLSAWARAGQDEGFAGNSAPSPMPALCECPLLHLAWADFCNFSQALGCNLLDAIHIIISHSF